MSLVYIDYIWVDGFKTPSIRGKTRVLVSSSERTVEEALAEVWNFDGSSTGQGTTNDSERLLVPSRAYHVEENRYVVLCEVCYPDDDSTPHETNYRANLIRSIEDSFDTEQRDGSGPEIWLGFEQEFFLTKDNKNIFWPESNDGEPINDPRYYCAVGGDSVKYRSIMVEHASVCNNAGINIVGYNSEVSPGQWEYQCFSKDAVKGCDDLWVSRYILSTIAEKHGLGIDWSPKPHSGWNGSGCHTNFSTRAMREGSGGEGLFDAIIFEMRRNHKDTMLSYGTDNRMRLVGSYETAEYDSFSAGIGSRGASVRIPNSVARNNWNGYMEDRRPASNCDPYRVVNELIKFI